MTALPDVPEDDRKYYRSSQDGEKGYLVDKDGQQWVRLNRPNEELLRPWNNGAHWIPEVEHRPLSPAQLAMVCFEADKALCRALGLHEQTRKEWPSLTDVQRIAWMAVGPTRHPARATLWKAINHVLEPLKR